MEIEFEGTLSGDNECFCWDNVPEEQRRKIVGEEYHKQDLEMIRELDEDDGPPAFVEHLKSSYTKELTRVGINLFNHYLS